MSNQTLTPTELDELLRLHQAAQPIPYRSGTADDGADVAKDADGREIFYTGNAYRAPETEAYLCAAANAVPALVAQVKNSKQTLDAIQNKLSQEVAFSHRLAARVRELEAENQQMRVAIKTELNTLFETAFEGEKITLHQVRVAARVFGLKL